MIESIKVKGLYDRFTYEVKLNEDVTIITGPNGFGKTTILNIILWLSECKYEKLYKLKFKEIIIKTQNERYVINKKNDRLFINNQDTFDKSFYDSRNKFYIDRAREYSIIKNIKHKFPRGYSLNEYIDNFSGFDDNILEEYKLEEYKNEVVSKNSKIKFKIKLKSDLGNVYFIQEQRLIKGNYKHEKDIVDVIGSLPNKFKSIINNVSNNYSSVSNNLDSTYPERLFQTKKGITENEYRNKIKDMRDKFDKLMKYDISEMKALYKNVSFKEEFSKALKIYFEDFDEKYKEYEELIDKLDLFVEIVNSKLQFKKIKVSRLEGIKVIDENGNNIDLKDLSSGEKQEIALFFELIFRTNKGTTLLIDEPEISLHVLWQKRFMNDLISVAKKMKLKAIVATHSPQIIGVYRDKQVDLGALYFGGFDNGSN